MITIPPEQIEAYRIKIQAGSDGSMHTDVGYFIAWFSAVEMGITALLALASRAPDLDIFDTLCSGMDARVKVERLRKIRKPRGGLGPNLDERIRYFEKARDIRNRLAHSFLARSERGPLVYYASSLGSLPWKALNEPAPYPNARPPIRITPAELLGWAHGLPFSHKTYHRHSISP